MPLSGVVPTSSPMQLPSSPNASCAVDDALMPIKMGIQASSTAQLAFGEDGNCIGELVGTTPLKGMSQMFHLMNYARIGVGIQSLSIASSAYLNALEYAKDRK